MITFDVFCQILELSGEIKYPEDYSDLVYDLFYEYYIHIGGTRPKPKNIEDIKKIKKELGL